jgi:hypothetical protein
MRKNELLLCAVTRNNADWPRCWCYPFLGKD